MSGAIKQVWWTAREIAEACLPDCPTSQQNVDAMAKREGWREDAKHARRRKARGGGWEYNWRLLPQRAQQHLLKTAKAKPEAKAAPTEDQRAEQHNWFESLPRRAKDVARDRLRVMQSVAALEHTGLGRNEAVISVANLEGKSPRTLWNWLGLIENVPLTDWLFYLAPRHRAAARSVAKAVCSKVFMDRLKSDYLRLEAPSFTTCYERAVRYCKAKGEAYLKPRTAQRHLNADVPRVTQIFAREGEAGLQRCFPPQIRDRSAMRAMEGVNADCHKFDVFVRWPEEVTPARAQLVAFQDIYSGKILSWRIDRSPNKVAVMAAFGDLIDDFGIPKHCLFDNGREFANKWLTGGAKTRFRFKIREDDPLGVLVNLGIKVNWATPGHGQAKPIERAFRDLADSIAKDPRFEGAYVGNKPDAKPENYGNRAIPIEEFTAVVADGIEQHNARLGRRTDTTKGGSFNETFAKSYETATIRKATDAQRRLWLMGQEARKLHANDGSVTLHGNKYWAAWINEYAGQKVIARFDPEDLHAGLYIYALDGAFLGMVECQEKVGFFDLTGAQEHSRQKAQIRRAEKQLLKAHKPLTAKELGDGLSEIAPEAPAELAAKVVQLVKPEDRPEAAKVQRPKVNAEPDSVAAENLLTFQKAFQAKQAARAEEDEKEQAIDRYRRAFELRQRADAGQRIGEAEARWLEGYLDTSEFRVMSRMHEQTGDQFLKR